MTDQHTPGNELARIEADVRELIEAARGSHYARSEPREHWVARKLRLIADKALRSSEPQPELFAENAKKSRSSEPQQEAVERKICQVPFCAVYGCQGAPHCTGVRARELTAPSPQPSAGDSNKLADEMEALIQNRNTGNGALWNKMIAAWASRNAAAILAALRQPTRELFAESAKNSSPGEAMEICPNCEGSGFGVADQLCSRCNGSGGIATVSPSPDVVEQIAQFVQDWNGSTADGNTFLIADEIREKFRTALNRLDATKGAET